MTSLHHVSVPVRDLDRARAFYRDIIGLTERVRPGFSSPGAWFAMQDRQVHLSVNPNATYRSRPIIDPIDIHHDYRVADFEATVVRIAALGYQVVPFKGVAQVRSDDDLMRLVADRGSPAGFLQAFLLDPDWHIVELNNAPDPQ